MTRANKSPGFLRSNILDYGPVADLRRTWALISTGGNGAGNAGARNFKDEKAQMIALRRSTSLGLFEESYCMERQTRKNFNRTNNIPR